MISTLLMGMNNVSSWYDSIDCSICAGSLCHDSDNVEGTAVNHLRPHTHAQLNDCQQPAFGRRDDARWQDFAKGQCSAADGRIERWLLVDSQFPL